MRPMLATPTESLPQGSGWVHEVKWDGMRILADVTYERTSLLTRTGRDATERFPEIGHLGELAPGSLFDGEVVTLDGGIPSFARLTRRIQARDGATALQLAQAAPVTYMVFDVLRFADTDVTGRAWRQRRALLEGLDLAGTRLLLPPTYDDGAALLAATGEQGLEGVVSKRADSGYTCGRRSRDWLKLAHRPTTSVVVGGWRPETGSAGRLGSLLVGWPSPDGTLAFAGRVGSGFTGTTQLDLQARLREAERRDSPFAPAIPGVDAKGATWVEPSIVIDVRALGEPGAGSRLRQPVFRGVREDLSADDLTAPGAPPRPEPDDVLE